MATEGQQHQPAVSSTGEGGGSEVTGAAVSSEGREREATPSTGGGGGVGPGVGEGGREVPASSDDVSATEAKETPKEGELL